MESLPAVPHADQDALPPGPEHDGALARAATFLMTDVQDSTPLWERHEALMRAVSARHDQLLDALISRHGGRRIKERGEGDSTFAVFADPAAALAAAVAIVRAVRAEAWPAQTPIHIRVGLHAGVAQWRDGDYYGPVINRAARIRGLGHGDQVLVSAAVALLARERLPDGVGLRSLGEHRLKGIDQPEEVFQALAPDLPDGFPPLLSPLLPSHNLPAQLSSFVGRDSEQASLMALLDAHRLVTLAGMGGAGKTRLALQVAAELADSRVAGQWRYPDGVWLVELAALSDQTLLPSTIIATLGAREQPGRPVMATLIDYLRDKRLLLVLDNCEHLIDACAEVAATLLRSCTEVHLLATSREALAVGGEQTYQVPALAIPLPRTGHPIVPQELAQVPSVALFVARASAHKHAFTLTADNAPSVAAICAQLDGIPLAIELAAARVATLGVAAIAGRLHDRLNLLTSGPRGASPRQRTLRALLDWSYELLTPEERTLLARLSVFAGGCTLQAIERICGDDGLEQWALADTLGGLVGKSLVGLDDQDEATRYRMLETVRQYGQERLAATEDATVLQGRHLTWYTAFAEQAADALTGPDQGAWLARLEGEHDNLRAALGWSTRQHDDATTLGLRLAVALWRFWSIRGFLREGRQWLTSLLALAPIAAPELRAAALAGAGNLARDQGDYQAAQDLFERCLALQRSLQDTGGIAETLRSLGTIAGRHGQHARAAALSQESLALFEGLDDRRGMAGALNNLGMLAWQQQAYAQARDLYERSLAIWQALDDQRMIGLALNNLGLVAQAEGDHARAGALYERSLALRRALQDTLHVATTLTNLGTLAAALGDYARATELHQESLALYRQADDRAGIAESLGNLADLARTGGDLDQAAALYGQSLEQTCTLGDQWGIALSLEGLAMIAATHGESARAAWLCGMAEAVRDSAGIPLPDADRAAYTTLTGALRDALGEQRSQTLWSHGRQIIAANALARVLDSARTPGSPIPSLAISGG